MDAIMAAGAKQSGFVLVQGPPGTGKTHTLFGILNALHLSVSQLSYDNVLPKKGQPFDSKAKLDWLSDPTNPHLLICAPSNAAIDNVLRLVTERGFKDGLGNIYKPTCVRIGSANWNRTSNSALSLEGMVDDLMQQRREWNDQSKAEVDGLKSRLRGLEARSVYWYAVIGSGADG
ncbi:hypothetical protein BASA81_012651 [Batrachochytrium salamandrivorans]|nr:hypothetical protein BASA81_012651 [Batrachochytrium salamandrivorans]